jgi:hypothetical protein
MFGRGKGLDDRMIESEKVLDESMFGSDKVLNDSTVDSKHFLTGR